MNYAEITINVWSTLVTLGVEDVAAGLHFTYLWIHRRDAYKGEPMQSVHVYPSAAITCTRRNHESIARGGACTSG